MGHLCGGKMGLINFLQFALDILLFGLWRLGVIILFIIDDIRAYKIQWVKFPSHYDILGAHFAPYSSNLETSIYAFGYRFIWIVLTPVVIFFIICDLDVG